MSVRVNVVYVVGGVRGLINNLVMAKTFNYLHAHTGQAMYTMFTHTLSSQKGRREEGFCDCGWSFRVNVGGFMYVMYYLIAMTRAICTVGGGGMV
jgi:hypothetical protein